MLRSTCGSCGSTRRAMGCGLEASWLASAPFGRYRQGLGGEAAVAAAAGEGWPGVDRVRDGVLPVTRPSWRWTSTFLCDHVATSSCSPVQDYTGDAADSVLRRRGGSPSVVNRHRYPRSFQFLDKVVSGPVWCNDRWRCFQGWLRYIGKVVDVPVVTQKQVRLLSVCLRRPKKNSTYFLRDAGLWTFFL